MVIPALVAVLLAIHPAPWKHGSTARMAGAVSATLAYDARATGYGQRQFRRVTLLIRRRGVLVLARRLKGASVDSGRLRLQLEDVWGSTEPEAVVTVQACGNRCSDSLYVALPRAGRLLYRDLGVEANWKGQRHDGLFEFVTVDGRFFCWFSACAATTMPVQVLAIDSSGDRFLDISRSRPDLLRRDAREQWSGYLQERRDHISGGLDPWWYGTFVPYCADEYRLGVSSYCDRILRPTVKRQLAAWGYR